jgi:DNA-binding NarL/FixJ family response regulator
MDISVPGMGGLEATRAIPKVCPDAKVLMLTLHDVTGMGGDGAPCRCSRFLVEMGYMAGLKPADTEGELMRALKAVAGNGIYAGPGPDPDCVNRIVLELGLII